MINKKLEDIKPEDLQNLIVNGVSESKTIEYKSELPLNTGDAKKEFLADVSSFANTSCGDNFHEEIRHIACGELKAYDRGRCRFS